MTTTAVKQRSLSLTPIGRTQACAFVDDNHRHHARPQGYKFAVGLHDGTELVGVGMAGLPVARLLNDGYTIEVIRVAVKDSTPNGCSMLYGALTRAAKALGYRLGVTYTQVGESGASLRASGWTKAAMLAPRSGWDTKSRPRALLGTERVERMRWEIRL